MARTEKSRKKTKFLFILIVLTAILSILSTYAWFSTQKDVAITGLNVTVQVAESMQISLDGETWLQTIAITDMKQLTGDVTDTSLPHAAADNTNYVPTSLEPVSTIGTLDSGKVKFQKGILQDNVKLTNITKCDETKTTNADHPYLYFDLYVRNIASGNDGDLETIHLDKGSSVKAQVDGLGLAESTRVGFLAFNTTPAALNLENGAAVRAAINAGADDKFSIWEPNFAKHTQAVVNSDPRIENATSAYTTHALKDDLTGEIANVQTEDATKMEAVKVNQVPQDASGDTAGQTKAATALNTVDDTDGTSKLAVAKNKITKIRIYLWLEGQDPDCVDVASTAKKIIADIKLVKPASTTPAGGAGA